MPEFRYIGFKEDIHAVALEAVADKTILIFPTEKSSKEAQKIFQLHWQAWDCLFLSMEEFKAQVIYSDEVNLMDEKRLVCLYQALTEEDKSTLHIEKYPDIVDWGLHFFDFFGELADECINPDDLYAKFTNNVITYQEWQHQNLTRLMAIRQQYRQFISRLGYSDSIFDRNQQNFHPHKDIKSCIFVNQYYYSALEKAIIKELENRGCRVTVIWQGKAQWFDEPTLKAKDFTLDDLYSDETLHFRLKIHQTTGNWQMALAFLADYDNRTIPEDGHLIVDAKFNTQPYKTIFGQDCFSYAEQAQFIETDVFIFMHSLSDGLQNLISDNDSQYVKLDWLLKTVGIKGFYRYFRSGGSERQKDDLLVYLCNLAEQNTIYLDVDLSICNIKELGTPTEEIRAFLKEVIVLLMRCSRITSISDFIDLIDSEYGIVIEKLVSGTKPDQSSILRCFYEALANFAAIDNLQLVSDWCVLYPQMSVAAGILDLFLQFLKPKTFQVYRQEQSGKRSIITNLMDTRNIQAGKVTFLNLVEGELPGKREPVWLLSERQGKEIGLKTWDDIRRWERYYFLRLLSSATEVDLYTISSQDNNVEPSSFLNELMLYATEHGCLAEDVWQSSALSLVHLFDNLIENRQGSVLAAVPDLLVTNSMAFFNLPYDTEQDFEPDKTIRLSWSSCERFIKDPLGYYLREAKKLKPRETQVRETMTRKMFGTLLHRYLMVISQRLAEQNNGLLSMKWDWINTDFLRVNLDHALSAPILKYQIPRNYNWEYLRELLAPYLIETAYWFFHTGLGKDPDFQDEFIRLIPEAEGMTMQERSHKMLLSAETNSLGIAVYIRGIADLRLETSNQRFIIDFKTGSADRLQLLFYMWFYYLIEHKEMLGSIRSAFYKLMDKEMQWLDFDSKYVPEKLTDTILQSLKNLAESGFSPATDASFKRYLMDISRVDLMSKTALEDEVE